MRILPDAKDLINLLEHDQPLTVEEFGEYLQETNGKLVLSYVNVSELVAPLANGREFSVVRALLQKLERLPLCYIREAPILIEEIKRGLEAFNRGSDPEPIDPYVERWDGTFHYPGPSVAQMYVNYRLDEIVYSLHWYNPAIFIRPKAEGRHLRDIINEDRQLPEPVRKNLKKRFKNTVIKHAAMWKLTPPRAGWDTFGEWLWENPSRSPGLRLNNTAFHELVTNTGDISEDNDIPDFAYVNAVPYVEAVTLDRRILDYCRRACRRLSQANPALSYEDRIFPSLEAFLGRRKQPEASSPRHV